MLDDTIPDILTVEERLAVIEQKLDYIIAFVNQAETTFKAMSEAMENNPMLKMLMG